MFRNREFWDWMQTKGTVRERIFSSVFNMVVGIVISVSGVVFLHRFIGWLVSRSISIDAQNNVLVASWLRYGLTGLLVAMIAVIALLLFYLRFLKESHKKDAGEKGVLADLLIRNVRKILDLAPSIGITYELDQRAYTIGKDGRDKIKHSWKITKTDKPVTLIPIKHYSTEAYKSAFLLNPALINGNGHAIDLPAWNLEREKEWLIFFSPPMENASEFEYEFEWPNFFGDLRTKGSDYVDYLAKQETKQAVIEIHSSTTDSLDWEEGMADPVGGSLERSKDGKGLTIRLASPPVGKEYKFRFRKY